MTRFYIIVQTKWLFVTNSEDKCSRRAIVKRNLDNYLGLAIRKFYNFWDSFLARQFLHENSTYLWLGNWHLKGRLLLQYGP
ncbi:hypothetical protein CFP56_005250 [Quercus suber]|uniref:Uncharacterized protein n=1 Tax=Quercus suber TaxID=58331 RepID=A0AAW0IG39_QUESU